MFNIGDRVEHYKELGFPGVIVQIDPYEICGFPSDVTTCQVLWDDSDTPDIQWTNKLRLLTE